LHETRVFSALTFKEWKIITNVSEGLYVAFFRRRDFDVKTTRSFQLSIHCYKISRRHIPDYNFHLVKLHKQDTLLSSNSLLVHLTCFKYKSVRTYPFLPLTVNLQTRRGSMHFMECKPMEILKNNGKRE
jgi:hypothetical protein